MMAGFVFKLQSILNIKIQMEDSLKNDLGKAVRKLEAEKNRLNIIQNQRDEYINEFNDLSVNGVVAEKLQEYSIFISVLKDRIAQQKDGRARWWRKSKSIACTSFIWQTGCIITR